MSLNLDEKKAVVAEVSKQIENAQAMILAEYRGVGVEDMTSLRAKARNSGVYLKVLKNKLVKRAVEDTSFSVDHLQANLSALMGAINKAKPTGTKGIFIKKLSISSTMGVGIKIDQASLTL